jgi:hypothetical protein
MSFICNRSQVQGSTFRVKDKVSFSIKLAASVFALRATTRHVARDAKIAEKKIKQVLCVLSVSACPMKSLLHLFHRGGENEYQNCSLLGGSSSHPF